MPAARLWVHSVFNSPLFVSSDVGVPQCSVLGPILLNCVMASLPSQIDNIGVKCHMYADDTLFWVSFGESESINNEKTASFLDHLLLHGKQPFET